MLLAPCSFPLPLLLHRLLNRFGSKQSQGSRSRLHGTAHMDGVAVDELLSNSNSAKSPRKGVQEKPLLERDGK